MKVTISNTDELLDFISKPHITDVEALTIINVYLDVFYPDGLSKAKLIRSVEHLLSFYSEGVELPFFPEVVN